MVAKHPVARGEPVSGSRFSVDVVILTPRLPHMGVLCRRARSGARELPWSSPRPEEHLEDSARRIARDTLGAEPRWLEQVGAFADGTPHPGGVTLSVGYVSVVPPQGEPVSSTEWSDARRTVGLRERHRLIVGAALRAVRERLDRAPVAFRLLAPRFTLTELQQVYEMLLGRRLHKASFRRALDATALVQPTSEWRSEGRGRPARLYRYVPRRRRPPVRGVRFDVV